MSNSILRNKSKEFAKEIIFLCKKIKSNYKESVLTNQLLRSSTSIGANIHKAQKILFQNFQLPKKNALKQNIG